MTSNNNKEKAIVILQSMENRLRNEFERIRDLRYNPNVKGQSYELIVKEFFEPFSIFFSST